MTLFDRTKRLTKQRGWNLQTTALKAGLSQNAIYNWKTKTPSEVSIKAVADVLGTTPEFLKGESKEPTPNKQNGNYINIDDDSLLIAFDGKIVDEDDRQAMINALKYHRYMKSLEDN
ncbi:helix-turn-helix domain-containing protein [Leuconostoc lactis]|uniref:helix-turn-helix domain-containing protein n=1 Tax=Leuconostoc lactis TaxID=1246 RepID=UPI0024AD32E5|nr:helix-turn-helix domain-containing protein [Leuconostoc lactis]MDI6495451.1 helix-turn-helix domain-containing protein [Leuconostoc lactis]